ncbi:MAG: PP2C family protein-serine/threonine phosphatase [Bacteroidota bacterium]|nr:PP2C family protein-serine/threonine phosphatase [Bacteroidota bacterium]
MAILETFDRFLTVNRGQAYNQYLDERNLKIFKVVLVIFIFIVFISIIINLGNFQSVNIALIISILDLIFLTILRVKYKNIFNISNIRKYLFIFLISQLLIFITIDMFYPIENNNETSENSTDKGAAKRDTLLKRDDIVVAIGNEDDDSHLSYIIFFTSMILIFRFSRAEILQLFSIGFGVPLMMTLLFNSKFDTGSTIPPLILGSIFFIVAITSESKRQRKFYEQYDFSYMKNHENLRMKKELNYAREIQLSMLPKNNATIGEIEISATSLPASEVGGDYFDYFKISEKEVGIFICDVSGHGVASGLLLSGLRSCMHLILEDNSNPKVVIEKLNRMIRKTQSRKMFVTAIFAIINTEKNKCMLFNAGHLPPYKISGESKEIFKIKKHGVALGAMNSVESKGSDNEVIFDFNKGDKLILYTDGVNEAMNSSKTEYGLDNLELYINGNTDKKTNELLDGLLNDVKKFTNNSLQRDDLTLLIVQRN